MRSGRRYTKDEILRRREKVADLYCRGATQSQIAERVSVSQRQVSDDLQKVRAWWLESALRSFDDLKSQELAKLDQIEREAWAAWERSVGTHKIERAEKRSSIQGDTTLASVVKEKLDGDPRYLQIVGNCVAKRCEILGLSGPVKRQPEIAVDVVSARERLAGELARMHERQLPEAVEAEATEIELETVQ